MFQCGSLTNEEFLKLHDYNLPSLVNFAPSFDIISSLMSLPNLDDYDIDEQMLLIIDSLYFTVLEIASISSSYRNWTFLHTTAKSFLLHHNEVVSLSI